MTLWSYFACVMTDPGKVPRGWHPFPNDEVAHTQTHTPPPLPPAVALTPHPPLFLYAVLVDIGVEHF